MQEPSTAPAAELRGCSAGRACPDGSRQGDSPGPGVLCESPRGPRSPPAGAAAGFCCTRGRRACGRLFVLFPAGLERRPAVGEAGRDVGTTPGCCFGLGRDRVAVINGFVLSSWPSRDCPQVAIPGLGRPTQTARRGGLAGGLGWATCSASLHGPVPSLVLDTLSSLSQALVTRLISGRKEQGMVTKKMAAGHTWGPRGGRDGGVFLLSQVPNGHCLL